MIDLSYNIKFQSIIFIIIFFVLASVILFPYFQAEIFTAFNSEEINSDTLCKQEIDDLQINTKLSYTKVIEFDSVRESATVYCIYKDSEYNTKVELEKVNKWQVIISTRLNKDSYFYYPFYI